MVILKKTNNPKPKTQTAKTQTKKPPAFQNFSYIVVGLKAEIFSWSTYISISALETIALASFWRI